MEESKKKKYKRTWCVLSRKKTLNRPQVKFLIIIFFLSFVSFRLFVFSFVRSVCFSVFTCLYSLQRRLLEEHAPTPH